MLNADKIGVRFNYLTIVSCPDIHLIETTEILCKCDCGSETIVRWGNLKRSHTKSCGCLQSKLIRERQTKHGWSKSGKDKAVPEYTAWCTMKNRCYTKTHKNYEEWGGRGIRVCSRWLESFDNFIEDMGQKPSRQHSLDRINNNGDYEPSNCRWATSKQQNSNKRNRRNLEYNGDVKSLSEWAALLGIDKRLLWQKLATSTFSEAYEFYLAKKKNGLLNNNGGKKIGQFKNGVMIFQFRCANDVNKAGFKRQTVLAAAHSGKFHKGFEWKFI